MGTVMASIQRKRIFLRRLGFWRQHRVKAMFLAGIAIVVALAGCHPETAYWSPSESSKQNRVDWVRFDHTVSFNAASRTLSEGELDRLAEFLERVDPRYGDQILVGTGAGGIENEMATGRVAAVIEYLRDQGLKVAPMPPIASARWDGTVRLRVGRYVVTPPNCPDWSKSASYDPANVPSSNFGCATAVNLGLMVADPGDLVRGRSAGPSDGTYGARMIRNYREGEKKGVSAPMITIQTGGGGAGGGAPQ
jgi:pilus assembly protein CpaD